jgi:hypothetical protein
MTFSLFYKQCLICKNSSLHFSQKIVKIALNFISNLNTLHIISCDYSYGTDRESVLALVKVCPQLKDINFMTSCHKPHSIFIKYGPHVKNDGLTEFCQLP